MGALVHVFMCWGLILPKKGGVDSCAGLVQKEGFTPVIVRHFQPDFLISESVFLTIHFVSNIFSKQYEKQRK